MKNVVLVAVSVLLLCSSEFLFSEEKSLEHENLIFSVLLSSGGSTGCPSSLGIKLINTPSELSNAFNYLYKCDSQSDLELKPPTIDLDKGSAVLLDMGAQGFLGNYITAIRMLKRDNKHYLTFATLEPGEGCWAPAQTQRPFQLIYFKEKIDSLNTRHIEAFESCDDR